MNSWDEVYAKGHDFAPIHLLLFKDIFIKILKATDNKIATVLDIGAGTGKLGIKLAKEGLDVTIADVSEIGLKKAQRNAQEAGVSIKTIQVDIESPEFTEKISKKYDLVIARHIYEFIDDKETFINKVYTDLLNDCGIFLLATPIKYLGIEESKYSHDDNMPLDTDVIKQVERIFGKKIEIFKIYSTGDSCDLYIVSKK